MLNQSKVSDFILSNYEIACHNGRECSIRVDLPPHSLLVTLVWNHSYIVSFFILGSKDCPLVIFAFVHHVDEHFVFILSDLTDHGEGHRTDIMEQSESSIILFLHILLIKYNCFARVRLQTKLSSIYFST